MNARTTVAAAGTCEPVRVDAVLTVAPGETFTIATTGDLCNHIISGTPSLFASFGAKQVSYSGSHNRARLVGDGSIGFKQDFLGARGSVGLSVRW